MNIKYIPVIICGIAFFIALGSYIFYNLCPVKYLYSKHYIAEMLGFISITLSLCGITFLLAYEIILII